MELYATFCALVFCSVLSGTLTYQERDVQDISRVLADVPNWRGLAGSLNTKVDDIEENCKTDIIPATCFRRSLVRRYCNMQRSENPRKVAEDIAGALEQMDHKLQAEQLRKLQFDGKEERERKREASGVEATLVNQPLRESANSPFLPNSKSTSNTSTGLRGNGRVEANIRQLRDQFNELKHATQMYLQSNNTPVDKLVEVVYSLPNAKKRLHQDFLMKFAEELVDSDTISVVFRRLDTHNYWDYLNIDILNHIITEFSLPSYTQLQVYKKRQQQFMKETTVKEFYEAEGDRQYIKPPAGFTKLITQHKWKSPVNLKEVDDFRVKFARKHDLHECAVILISAWGGSVIITMMVPESIMPLVNSTGIEFFKEHGIVHALLNGTCVYKQTEEEISPSAVQPPLEDFLGGVSSVSMHETSGFGTSLTSPTYAAGTSSSLEPRSMRPHPLQPLETAKGSAVSREFTDDSITDLIQQNWIGALVTVMIVVVSTCTVLYYFRGASDRRPTVFTSQQAQPPLYQMTTSTDKKPDFVEEPPNDMICPVTKSVMLEPHQTHCCGKHLSAEAATKLQEKGGTCPLCREPDFTSYPDKYFRRSVRDLQVYCPNKKEQCEWVGKLCDMGSHEKLCPRKKDSSLETDLVQLIQSTPRSTTQGKEQEEKEEKEVLRDQLNLDSKDIKVRWKGLSSTDSDEESCSSENSSLQLETDLTQLSQSPTQSSTQRKEQKRDKVREKAELDIKDNRFALKWRDQKRAPENMIRGTAVVHGTAAYIIGRDSHTIYSYKLDSDTWNKHSECPHVNPGLVIINDFLTAVGGREGDSITKKVVSYNHTEWIEQFPPMQTPRDDPAIVHHGNYVIALGGGHKEKGVELLDIPSCQWSTVTSLPSPVTNITATLCNDNIIVMDYRGYAYTINVDLLREHSQWIPLPRCPVDYNDASIGGPPLTTLHEQCLVVLYNGIFQLQERQWVRIGDMFVPMLYSIVCVVRDQMVVVGGRTPPSFSLRTCTDAVRVAINV